MTLLHHPAPHPTVCRRQRKRISQLSNSRPPSLIRIEFTFWVWKVPLKWDFKWKCLAFRNPPSPLRLFILGEVKTVSRGHLGSIIFLWKFYDDCSFHIISDFVPFNVSTRCSAAVTINSSRSRSQNNLFRFSFAVRLINGRWIPRRRRRNRFFAQAWRRT